MSKELITTQMKVKDNLVSVLRVGDVDYISLTDLAKFKNDKYPANVIIHWLSNKETAFYVGLWEELNNENFNSVESHRIKIDEVGYNRFTMTPNRWKRDFNAIGIIPSSGKYSKGTFAHPDIAFEFASWLSPEFKLYLIKEFERLKTNEAYQYKIEWSATRLLSKVNYVVHTDAIKECIVPNLTESQKQHVYSDEADILNVALFGMTAKEWRNKNPKLAKNGNIRDYTDLLHLVILNNLENINAELIEMKIPQNERLIRLNNIARKQMELLKNNKSFNNLEYIKNKVNNKQELPI